jgi:glycerophosphoryl diester phosphodiesterase
MGFFAPDGSRPFANTGLKVPTLEEVLVELGRDVVVNVDVKQRQPSMVGPLLELIRRLGAEDRVRLTSFDARVMRAIRARRYAGQTGLAQAEVMAALVVPEAVLKWLPMGTAVQVPPRAMGVDLTSKRLLDKWHALGWRVDYWVINDPTEARRLVAGGADGIMTDDPAKIAPALRG